MTNKLQNIVPCHFKAEEKENNYYLSLPQHDNYLISTGYGSLGKPLVNETIQAWE
jgi:hypothetical protein